MQGHNIGRYNIIYADKINCIPNQYGMKCFRILLYQNESHRSGLLLTQNLVES